MTMHEAFLDINYPTTLARYTDPDFKFRQMVERFYLSLDLANMKVIFGERSVAQKKYRTGIETTCHS